MCICNLSVHIHFFIDLIFPKMRPLNVLLGILLLFMLFRKSMKPAVNGKGFYVPSATLQPTDTKVQ